MNKSIFSLYPKIRPDLPAEYKAIYEKHYFDNRNGEYKTTSLSQRLEAWMHRQVAADLMNRPTQTSEISTLEIGAGTLNQLPYEPVVGSYDIVEPFHVLYDKSPQRERIRNTFDDISEARTAGPYDRITNIAVFEHIMDLPLVVAHAALMLKANGTLRVAIPNEGTPMWRLGTMVTGFEFKKRYGLSYDVLLQYEHVNTANEIEQVLEAFFSGVRSKVFGLCKRLALYRFYECNSPKTEEAQRFVDIRG